MNDSLGDRMKNQYENRTRYMLPRRTWTILRADGKAFHSLTRRCQKPEDPAVVEAMDTAARDLCELAQGACFAYVQSDEISVVLQDMADIRTEAWFDGNLQKIVSVAASIVTAGFNVAWRQPTTALFDCRAFTIPDPIEVENYFIWRQQDATRNSVQSLTRAHFSHKDVDGKNTSEMHELLRTKGINWNDIPTAQKRGRAVVYSAGSGWDVDREIPIFTADRDYVRVRMNRAINGSLEESSETPNADDQLEPSTR